MRNGKGSRADRFAPGGIESVRVSSIDFKKGIIDGICIPPVGEQVTQFLLTVRFNE